MIENGGVHAFRRRENETGERWNQTIQEMGTTGAISSRLFELQNEYGDGVRFSVVNLDGLSSDAQRRSRELSEVRYDLIGAHF